MAEMSDQDVEERAEALLTGDTDDVAYFFSHDADLAKSTARSYRASWNDFLSWCKSEEIGPLPADGEAVASYIRARSHLALSTLRTRLSALSFVHRHLDLPDPTKDSPAAEARKEVAEKKQEETHQSPSELEISGSYSPTQIVRGGLGLFREYMEKLMSQSAENIETSTLQEWQSRREQVVEMWRDPMIEEVSGSVKRLTPEQKKLILEVQYDLSALRDRAILLLMGCSTTSRVEVVRTDFADLVVNGKSLLVGIRKKNDMPNRKVRLVPSEDLNVCPVRAITAWCVAAGLRGGPLFRSFDSHGNLKESRIAASSVNLLVEKAADDAGLTAEEWMPSRLQEEPEGV
jgi:site-specific recombinase XerD